MKNFICNSFSLQMLPDNFGTGIEGIGPHPFDMLSVESISPEDIPEDTVSAIGHADTAKVLSGVLGREIEANRINVSLDRDSVLYVAQLVGGRLPEGATTLPEGALFRFYRITLADYFPADMDCGGVCSYPHRNYPSACEK